MNPLVIGFMAGLLLSLVAPVKAELPTSLTPLPQRPPAPDFTLPDLDGNVQRLTDYRGKAVILNFWATWCPPCLEEMPAMQRAWEQVQDEDIVLIAINVGEDEDTVFTFLADYPVDFPLLLDEDSTVIADWPVRGIPTTFVIDPQGRMAYRAIGGRDWDQPEMLDPVRALLQESAAGR
ncbi:TlpA family protein disulfide reductase [Ectothiorhodospiraceae bacterium 2226]|nr:TlpA family protein disulfide reductase [Ectothiorhodospiraceae bacterium 2226]